MNNYKNIWTEVDFEEMDFHDCRIYGITFPDESGSFKLDIDYMFEWILNKETNLFKFIISPCTLTFDNVCDFKINIDLQILVGVAISYIQRNIIDEKTSEYIVETDNGVLSFKAQGYTMTVRQAPILSESLCLGR